MTTAKTFQIRTSEGPRTLTMQEVQSFADEVIRMFIARGKFQSVEDIRFHVNLPKDLTLAFLQKGRTMNDPRLFCRKEKQWDAEKQRWSMVSCYGPTVETLRDIMIRRSDFIRLL